MYRASCPSGPRGRCPLLKSSLFTAFGGSTLKAWERMLCQRTVSVCASFCGAVLPLFSSHCRHFTACLPASSRAAFRWARGLWLTNFSSQPTMSRARTVSSSVRGAELSNVSPEFARIKELSNVSPELTN